MASIVLRCSTSEQALYRLLRLFYKSQSALTPLLLLSKSNPLRWASIWYWVQIRKFRHLYCCDIPKIPNASAFGIFAYYIFATHSSLALNAAVFGAFCIPCVHLGYCHQRRNDFMKVSPIAPVRCGTGGRIECGYPPDCGWPARRWSPGPFLLKLSPGFFAHRHRPSHWWARPA